MVMLTELSDDEMRAYEAQLDRLLAGEPEPWEKELQVAEAARAERQAAEQAASGRANRRTWIGLLVSVAVVAACWEWPRLLGPYLTELIMAFGCVLALALLLSFDTRITRYGTKLSVLEVVASIIGGLLLCGLVLVFMVVFWGSLLAILGSTTLLLLIIIWQLGRIADRLPRQ
jgi:hypothetical protein